MAYDQGRLSKDQRLNKIREFVSSHQKPITKQTKADVIRHMHKTFGCATDTTFNDIGELVRSGEFKIEKRSNQMHYLIINDKSEFHFINRWLTMIESIIAAGEYKPRRRDFLKPKIRSFLLQDAVDKEFGIQFHYNTIIDVFLDVLLVKTNEMVQDESSRQELFTRIIRLTLKAPSKNSDTEFNMTFLGFLRANLEDFRDKVLSFPLSTKSAKIRSAKYTELVNNLLKHEEIFEQEFQAEKIVQIR